MTKSNNSSLHLAKTAKEDEFYTQITDIEKELRHYRHHFKGKHVFLNCDDPKHSNFWRYFELNFGFLEIEQLTATHYDSERPTYRIDIYYDENGQQTFIQTNLKENGDFRSEEAISILKECDIVVTNPPFSLFREFIAQLIEYNKDFLIIGSQNNITYKEVFPLLKSGKVWLGVNHGDMSFKVPEHYEPRKTRFWIDESGQKWRSLGNICWYTNLDYKSRYEEQILFRTYEDSQDDYPHYFNYDAIDCSRVKDIPMDYEGVIGVPITFLNNHNPEQFSLIGLDKVFDETFNVKDEKALLTKKSTGRASVDYDATVPYIPEKHAGKPIYIDDTSGEMYVKLYRRLFIKNKKPTKPAWR